VKKIIVFIVLLILIGLLLLILRYSKAEGGINEMHTIKNSSNSNIIIYYSCSNKFNNYNLEKIESSSAKSFWIYLENENCLDTIYFEVGEGYIGSKDWKPYSFRFSVDEIFESNLFIDYSNEKNVSAKLVKRKFIDSYL
jgi:hypothetical protein